MTVTPKGVRFVQIVANPPGVGGDPKEGDHATDIFFPPILFALDTEGQVWAYEFSGKDEKREWYRFRMPEPGA